VNSDAGNAHPRTPCGTARASGRTRLTIDEAQSDVAVWPFVVLQTHARSIPLVAGIAPLVIIGALSMLLRHSLDRVRHRWRGGLRLSIVELGFLSGTGSVGSASNR